MYEFIVATLTHLGSLALIALIVSVVLFPLAFVLSFIYAPLARKLPPFVAEWLCIFIGAFVALLILEFYLGYTIPQALVALAR